jgi:hypothetical protein
MLANTVNHKAVPEGTKGFCNERTNLRPSCPGVSHDTAMKRAVRASLIIFTEGGEISPRISNARGRAVENTNLRVEDSLRHPQL